MLLAAILLSPSFAEMAGKDPTAAGELATKAAQLARRAVERRTRGLCGWLNRPSPGAIESDTGDTTFGIADAKALGAYAL